MFSPYLAKDAKQAADSYYGPLTQIFDYIRSNASKGMYAVSISGTEISQPHLEMIQKAGYSIQVKVDENQQPTYLLSWAQVNP